jgi:hypothetical protein
VEDHHVDRPAVEAQQCVKPTGTNRSFGLIQPHRMQRSGPHYKINSFDKQSALHHPLSVAQSVLRRPGGYGEEIDTRSHPELGRENPQRRWYCVLRRGRVGRRQVFPEQINKYRPQRIPYPLPPGSGPSQARKPAWATHNQYRGVEQPGSSSGS